MHLWPILRLLPVFTGLLHIQAPSGSTGYHARMKMRKRELAKPGIYGSVDNPIVVTEAELKEIAETFGEIKKAPISLSGHYPDPQAPRLGNVVAVEYDEKTKTLSGTVEEQEVLSQAVDDGFYADVSIGGKRRASDGKMYLHHLAYLGEEPPAVKDLVKGITESLSGETSDVAASEGSADVVYPSPSAGTLSLSDPIQKTNHNIKKESQMDPGEIEKLKAELEEEKKKNSQLTVKVDEYKKKLGELAEKYPDENLELSDSDPRVSALMSQLRGGKKAALFKAAEGVIPKGQSELLGSLADSLSLSSNLELSDKEGKKEQISALDALTRLVESLPKPVTEGRLHLSDESGKSLDLSKIKGKI